MLAQDPVGLSVGAVPSPTPIIVNHTTATKSSKSMLAAKPPPSFAVSCSTPQHTPSVSSLPTQSATTAATTVQPSAKHAATSHKTADAAKATAATSGAAMMSAAVTAAATTLVQPGHQHQHQHGTNQASLPVCTTYTNCSNPKEHFLPNDTSIDDEYLSECENCKSTHGSRYYLNEPVEEQAPQETMTLQRKMEERATDEDQTYYRASSTLPTNTKQKQTA